MEAFEPAATQRLPGSLNLADRMTHCFLQEEARHQIPMVVTATTTTTAIMSQIQGAMSKRTGRVTKARSLACRECRDRKIRCDGARPVCDSCSRRGLGSDQCRYPEIEHEGSIASSRSYIRALQKRVQELEDRERQAQALIARSNNGFTPVSSSNGEGWGKPVEDSHQRPANVDKPILPSIHADGTYSTHGFPSAFANLAMPHETPRPYYPPHRGQMGASPPLTDDLDDFSPLKSSFGSYSTNNKAALMLGKISLPPTEMMDGLLGEYFESDWITMPLLHRPSFINKYDRLIAVANSKYRRDIPLQEATELAATYCLTLGILALGEHPKSMRADASTEATRCFEFHEQARGLLLTDLISTPSLLVVQALLVHARFLRRCGSSQESWVLVGMAHRLAEGLGLPIDLPGRTQAEREECRRTWCTCAYMLRMQSTPRGKFSASGRPEFGSLPQEVDDEYLETQERQIETSQPLGVPSTISFFVHSLRLSDAVLQPIQDTYFSRRHDEESFSDILGTTLKLDSALQAWYDSLPRHLQRDSVPAQRDTLFSKQAILMRVRYLEAKALLSRATIMVLVKRHTGAPIIGLTKVLLSGVLDACYSASIDLMDLVSYQKEFLAQVGVPDYHTVISLCNIGMTLNILANHPLFSDPIKSTAYEKETRRCVSIVKRYHTCRDPLADRYTQALEALTQPRSRSPSVNGTLDPVLEAVMPREDQQSDKVGATKAEMAMLDAWYKMEPDYSHNFSISEIASFW